MTMKGGVTEGSSFELQPSGGFATFKAEFSARQVTRDGAMMVGSDPAQPAPSPSTVSGLSPQLWP